MRNCYPKTQGRIAYKGRCLFRYMRLNSPPWREEDVIEMWSTTVSRSWKSYILYFVTYPGVPLKSFFNPLLNVSYIDHEALAFLLENLWSPSKTIRYKIIQRYSVNISIIKARMFLFPKNYSTLSGIQTWISKNYSCVILQNFYTTELALHMGSIMPGDLAGVCSTKYKNIIIRVVGTGSKWQVLSL